MGAVKEIDRGWNRITKELKSFENSFVKVGVLSTAGNYEGTFTNIVDIATANEYGTSQIPERPFMRQTFSKNQIKVQKRLEHHLKLMYEGKSNVATALSDIGSWYVGRTKLEFTQGNFTPNAPSTIAEKHSSRPLIRHSHLRQSINYEMVIRGRE